MAISFSLHGDQVAVRFGGQHFHDYKMMIRSFDFPRYNGEAKAWVFPINFLKRIIPLLSTLPETPEISRELYDRMLDDRAAVERAMALRTCKEHDFTPEGFKGSLYGFQKIGAACLCQGKRMILGDDVGLGKTVQTLGASAHLLETGAIDTILIVCPGHLKRQWAGEVAKFTYWEPILIEGPRQKREWQFGKDAKIFITNYELLSRDPEYLTREWGLVILDEAQEIKSYFTQAAKLARKLKSSYKWALTATPIENSLPELHSILEFISPGLLGQWHEFDRIYVKRNIFGAIEGYQRLDRLKEIVKPYLLRRRVEDCLNDFPTKESLIVPLDFTPEQAVVYKDVRARVLEEEDSPRMERINASARMNQVGFLRQACDDTQLISSEMKYPCAKMEWLKKVVADITARGDKVVIFTEWERMGRIISHELSGAPFLHGGLNFQARHSILSGWRKDESPLVTTDCSNVGLNLQEANWIISYELHWNPAVMKQRAGRVWRLTQKKPVHVLAPYIRNSIEEKVLQTLAGKTDLFKTVIDSLASEAKKENLNR